MSAIRDFPIPVSKTSLRSWLGLCQQLSLWYPELASCQSGLCHLVRDDVEFVWTDNMTAQMEATKQLLCGDVYVTPYDTMLVPTIFANGSIINGAGYILVQQEGKFFANDDYKMMDNITEVTTKSDVCSGLENVNYVKMSKSQSDFKKSQGEGGIALGEALTTNCDVSLEDGNPLVESQTDFKKSGEGGVSFK